MLENYASWLDYARGQGRRVELQDLLLVRHCTLTGDWATVTWNTSSKDVRVSFVVQAPGGLGSGGLGFWGSWERHNSVPGRSGPYRSVSLSPNEEPDFNQCIFLKGMRLVQREWYIKVCLQLKAHVLGDDTDDKMPTSSSTSTFASKRSIEFRVETLGDVKSPPVSPHLLAY